MIDIDKERLLTVEQVAEFLPRVRRGKRIHKATVYRWMSKGVGGVRLESLRVGGTWMTSIEALQRFAMNRGRRPPASKRAQAVDAERKLEECGF